MRTVGLDAARNSKALPCATTVSNTQPPQLYNRHPRKHTTLNTGKDDQRRQLGMEVSPPNVHTAGLDAACENYSLPSATLVSKTQTASLVNRSLKAGNGVDTTQPRRHTGVKVSPPNVHTSGLDAASHCKTLPSATIVSNDPNTGDRLVMVDTVTTSWSRSAKLAPESKGKKPLPKLLNITQESFTEMAAFDSNSWFKDESLDLDDTVQSRRLGDG
ncbi:hypothetical protein PSTG_13456 [Puccinia striiformis f. sp. tritici PST-78]|uniref:Uncharacterized protein n=1 Tax=Puccinia striiformis f. sp. tritici PST-78 TaxID=1165861 RepID=A0A0L0V1L7_9BASI|nr:hypothetical protein PSTG_13456 [Puccinia striiformis f. sp. tritici PST-78]